ncbi:L,D-peptidoglycan transpeptidase YkuD, ErfK/YbiS/YcfS/YnhG family [Carnobacterium iners]|uniref:L,D-peptidoglycan transpeptidase YkuD, ErfK/YbiS/YcfS/YnhG family n=1 Tax=Carnobacterium iners TaxID=1073423 RepID=A0A1X7NS47_9LACT|nr:L,D-transpeptidase family protein [Carnobacterium iners]SEK89341.1 L,D-peptidoglycan transpeptidase YkuD, ErfK/YbiS/YcfS/YnhG family [Carnobacterium iners]SMH40876.1 L,D-peptidoglycan transpeptidase YkuD, ErfK/YbiS/YcfS/YnhG family [Carnobacterium iners]
MRRKKKQLSIAIVLIVFIILGGINLYRYNINVKAKEIQKEINTALILVKKKTKLLYLNEKEDLLSESITKEKIKGAETSLKIVSALQLSETQQKSVDKQSIKIATAKQLFSIQSSIHKKFKNEKITSDDIEFSKEEKELVFFKITHPLFFKEFNEIIEQSKLQLVVKQALLLFFEDYDKLTIKETISRSEYDRFKEKLESLSSESFKTSLINACAAIEQELDRKETKEKEEREKERKETELKQINETKKEEIKEVTSISESTPTSKETTQDKTDSQPNTPASQIIPPQQVGIEGTIARSSTSNYTNQIIGVVANGSSSTVYLFEKNGEQWQTVLSMPGRVGYNGVGSSYEGSGRTPKGAYLLGFAFGTGPNPGTNLAYRQITGNSYWISNPDDSQYNTWQERVSSSSLDEHMSDYQTQYKYGITLNYNNGVNGGSAFFVHVNGNGATAGCISVSESNMLYLMQHIRNGAHIINVNNESELANY